MRLGIPDYEGDFATFLYSLCKVVWDALEYLEFLLNCKSFSAIQAAVAGHALDKKLGAIVTELEDSCVEVGQIRKDRDKIIKENKALEKEKKNLEEKTANFEVECDKLLGQIQKLTSENIEKASTIENLCKKAEVDANCVTMMAN